MKRTLLLSVAALLVVCQSAFAANKLFIDPQTVQIGQTNVAVPIKLDNDQALYGYSLSIKSNASLLKIVGLDLEGTAIAAFVADGGWSFGQVLDSGARTTWGVVLDVTAPFDIARTIPVGKGVIIANLRVDVTATAAGSASITFEDVAGATPSDPDAKNVLVGDNGEGVAFTTAPGNITIGTGEILFTRGDANDDETVDLSDAVTILGDLFLGNPASAPCRDALDGNDDGTIDLSDAVAILSFLFMGGADIPPPYDAPGTDPTPDVDIPPCTQ